MLGFAQRWRVIVEDRAHLCHFSTVNNAPWRKVTLQAGPVLPCFQATQLPDSVLNSPTLMSDYRIFAWFSDDYLLAFRKQPLVLVDGRYLMSWQPLTALWGIQFPTDAKQAHITRVRNVRAEGNS